MEVMEVIDLTTDVTEESDEDFGFETSIPSGNAVETSSFEDQIDGSAVNIETLHQDLEEGDSDSVASGDASDEAPETQAEDSEVDSESSDSDDEFNQEVLEFVRFDDGDPNNDSDSDEDSNWQGDCVQSCQPKYEKIHEKSQLRKFRLGESRQLMAGFRAKIRGMNTKIRGMKTQIRRLRADLAAARTSASSAPRRTKAMWPVYMKWFLRGQWGRLPPGIRSYEDIYKLSCRESNMPWHPNRVLPGLVLREKDDGDDGAIESIAVTGGFNFDQLPIMAQFRVLQMLLCFYGKKVHVLTRLDPYHVPSLSTGVLGNDPERPQLLRRFHIGDSPWLFWGAHLFYETNRLSTLDIYIPESSEQYMRRNHETSAVIKHMKWKTQHQPNYRMFRSLRTVQGLDYVHCLRGISRITFWDHSKWIAHGQICKVRDKTFQLDVARTVRGPKHPKDQRNASLKTLAPLVPGMNPSADVWRTMAMALPGLRDELLETDDGWEDEEDNNVGGSGTSCANSSDEYEDEESDADDGSESGSDSDSDTSDGDSVQILFGGPVAVNDQQAISVPGSPVNSNHGVQTRSIPRLSNNANSENRVTVKEDTMDDSLPNIVDLTLNDDEDGYEDTQNEALTQNSSQTIRDDGMKAEPISEDSDTNITNANENSNTQEESLFIDGNNSNSTGEVTYDNRTSLSPEKEAMRAISAHVEESQEHGSPASSNSDSEGNIFASPTPYNQIVQEGTSTGARTVRSEISSSLCLGSGDLNGPRSPSSESSASKTSKRSHNGNDEGSDRESESRKRQRSEGPFAGGSGSSIEDCIELL